MSLRKTLFLSYLFVFLSGCMGGGVGNFAGNGVDDDDGSVNKTNTWDFTTSANYTFDSNFVEFTSGKATLKTIDTDHDTDAEFAGTHTNTQANSNDLELTAVSSAELSSDWTPQFSNLVSYWQMNNDFNDSVGGNNGTANGATFTTSAKSGSHAGSFDGVNDYVQIPDSDDFNLTNFTVASWVKISDGSSDRRIISQQTGAGYWVFHIKNSRLTAWYSLDGINDVSHGPTLLDDTWYHVALVRDTVNDKLVWYINGVNYEEVATVSNTPYTIAADVFITSVNGVGQHFDGALDELAIWNVALTDDEMARIYSTQSPTYHGEYQSPIMDLGTSTDWLSLSWLTDLPYGKELPLASETSTNYSAIVGSTGSTSDGDNLTGLLGLWRMNEASWNGTSDEVKDAKNTNHGTADDNATTNIGKFYRGGVFDGTNDAVSLATDAFSDAQVANGSIIAWVKVNAVPAASDFFSILDIEGYTGHNVYESSGEAFFQARIFAPGEVEAKDAANAIQLGRWYHYAQTWDGTNLRLYIDGTLRATQAATSPLPDSQTRITRIGAMFNTSRYLNGELDEVSLWSRALHADEIKQQYLRGSNDIRFQVRTCDDAACDIEAWQGPDGTNQTYFSELHNYIAIDASGNGSTAVRATSPKTTFSQFTAAGGNTVSNRYFQYKFLMSSDSSGDLPKVSSLSVEPDGNYYGGNPTVTNNNSVAFTDINSISFNVDGNCSPTYRISNNGTTFYYWNGTQWQVSSLLSSPAGDIIANIDTFAETAGPGNFYFRAILNSDTTESCEINSIDLDYN